MIVGWASFWISHEFKMATWLPTSVDEQDVKKGCMVAFVTDQINPVAVST